MRDDKWQWLWSWTMKSMQRQSVACMYKTPPHRRTLTNQSIDHDHPLERKWSWESKCSCSSMGGYSIFVNHLRLINHNHQSDLIHSSSFIQRQLSIIVNCKIIINGHITSHQWISKSEWSLIGGCHWIKYCKRNQLWSSMARGDHWSCI